MKRTILLATIAVALLCSCQTKKSVLSSNYIAGSTYSGTLPCEDCNGINQVVILDSGNTFRLSETYLGKQDQCTEKKGRWSVENGKLMLYSDTAHIASYAVSGGNLVYLNKDNFAFSNHPTKGYLSRKKLIHSKKINEKYLEGLDIVAFGADATWSLDISHKKAIKFSVAGTEAPFSFSPVVPKVSGDTLTYNVITDNEKMKIVFVPGFCGDNTNENIYDYKVSVSFRGKTYTGCGAILNADGDLDGTWILQSFEGHKNSWSEQPYLNVDLGRKIFYGFTGCNRFAGSARMKDNFVCFSDINASEKEHCDGYDEAAFIDAIVRCNGFTINQGILELTQNGKTILIFKRQTDDSNQL